MRDNYRDNSLNGDSNKSDNLDIDHGINDMKELDHDIVQKTNSSFVYELDSRITGSYFCFRCGAIMTTKDDKKQHEHFESNKKPQDNDIEYGH